MPQKPVTYFILVIGFHFLENNRQSGLPNSECSQIAFNQSLFQEFFAFDWFHSKQESQLNRFYQDSDFQFKGRFFFKLLKKWSFESKW